MHKRRTRQPQKELWIGLAKVEQASRNGVLGDADRAYTSVIAITHGRLAFRASVKRALEELGLGLIRLEKAEPLKARLSKYSIHKKLAKLAKEVTRTGHTAFGTFHAFDTDDK